ncbi:phage tail tape measure protein [Bacillus sp. es.036]|uniref:phage tail tape measure protein n=1 Tax=Bacillus sp. es.036 TaxID=1761764 RepID=UPI000BF4756B|nr:phage tail tape measure protein [Bacillus sp. es.036]PFG03033.1 hypothetical protein ATG70_4262 [Bacillus sp. es.036]
MTLFKSATEKVIKVRERIQAKREELQKKQAQLNDEIKALVDQKENEFQQAILEDDTSYSDTKIRKAIGKANEELQDVRQQLASLDDLEAKQLEGLKGEIDTEFRKVRNEETERLNKHEREIQKMKMEYFKKFVEYTEEVKKSEARLREVNNVKEQVGLKTTPIDMKMMYIVNQYTGTEFHPMVVTGEMRDVYNGRIPYSNEVIEKYSK